MGPVCRRACPLVPHCVLITPLPPSLEKRTLALATFTQCVSLSVCSPRLWPRPDTVRSVRRLRGQMLFRGGHPFWSLFPCPEWGWI